MPEACLLLGYDLDDGSALVAPLSGSEPVIGHVRGEVVSVEPDAIELRVAGALIVGVGGSGNAVHGELRVAVREPGDELRASAIDAEATGRIVVGGSRASAETLTRARAMGVAGIVLGGVLDKELRDFEATQQRRREIGGVRGDFAVLLLEGYGKVGFDPGLFAWFRAHDGHLASLFGEEARLYVYAAGPPPARRSLPRPGDRVIAHRRPHAGLGGTLLRVLDQLHAAESGVVGRYRARALRGRPHGHGAAGQPRGDGAPRRGLTGAAALELRFPILAADGSSHRIGRAAARAPQHQPGRDPRDRPPHRRRRRSGHRPGPGRSARGGQDAAGEGDRGGPRDHERGEQPDVRAHERACRAAADVPRRRVPARRSGGGERRRAARRTAGGRRDRRGVGRPAGWLDARRAPRHPARNAAG